MSKSKAKGTQAESDVVNWLIANGYPNAKRNVLGVEPDVEPIPAAKPPILISVKEGYSSTTPCRSCGRVSEIHPQTVKFHEWWSTLNTTWAKRNSRGLRLLVHKRYGKGSPSHWHWYCYQTRIGIIKVTGPQVLDIMREHMDIYQDNELERKIAREAT